MATPSRPNPGATPTHLTPSPHPSAAPMGRHPSHKSPSMRTPSASGHAPGQHPSTSSQPYTTPLAASTGLDDPVTFSSPSALLALGSYTGLSPATNGQDGLGSGINDGDIQSLGIQTLGLGGAARDQGEERKKNVEEAVQLLATRLHGRGVSREAVERLAQLTGFESIWQEDSLNIAGNLVDLEIEFYPGEDNVKDVRLAYATPDAQEGERREEATAVLKRNLIQSPEERERHAWKSLKSFHRNLSVLARLDKLSQEVNCFEAIEGLHQSLRKIWEEETKRGNYRGTYEHLCRGVIGRPSLHRGRRIGMGLEYWVDRHRLLDAKERRHSPDAMHVDGDESQEDAEADQIKLRSVMIECEAGFPSLKVSKDWVGPSVFSMETNTSDEADATASIDWLDPGNGNQSDSMALDSGMAEPGPQHRRFVAKLEPSVDVPLLAATEVYRRLGLAVPQEYRVVVYDTLLVPNDVNGSAIPSETLETGIRSRRKSVVSFDAEGRPIHRHHSYTFQAFEAIPGRTLSEFPFSHPRQLTAILPVSLQSQSFLGRRLTCPEILRQYGLVTSLIQNTFAPEESKESRTPPGNQVSQSTEIYGNSTTISGKTVPDDSQITVLTNDDPNEDFLDHLLEENSDDHQMTDAFSETGNHPLSLDYGLRSDGTQPDDARVDITLRTLYGQAPLIMLLISIPDAAARTFTMVSIQFEVRLNGRIKVNQVVGLLDNDNVMQGGTEPTPEMQKLHEEVRLVLETTEDIGILVEWVRERLHKARQS